MSTATEQELSLTLSHHVSTVTFGDLPPDAVQIAKFSTLDTLGVTLGASGLMAEMPKIVELVRQWGGRPESTMIGFGGKVPSVNAAFVNGAMAHGLDFDDCTPQGHHPSSSVIPALFAATQLRGGVTGREFITALALGQDIFTRMRTSVAWKQDWFLSPVLGTLAAAAACAKLLDLDERDIVNALGIACCQAAGTMQLAYGTGGDLRGIYAGFGAKAGLFSALLAQAGVTATSTPFSGEAGFLKVYFDDDWDRGTMLDGLGEDFRGSTTIYKMWPCIANTHGYIDTALRLMGSPGRTEEIEKLVVHGGDFARRLVTPVELRRRPGTVNDAKSSIPYTVALALVRGTVGVGDFSAERRRDPDVAAMADKIEFVDETKYDWSHSLPSGAVKIILKDGGTLFGEWQHDETPGAAKRPLTWPELVGKFEDCASYAVVPMGGDATRAVVRAVADLDRLDDAATVVELLG